MDSTSFAFASFSLLLCLLSLSLSPLQGAHYRSTLPPSPSLSFSRLIESPHGVALLTPLAAERQRPPCNSSSRREWRQRRDLLGSSEAHARMMLYDDLLTKGYYTGRLWIGTPPQEFALIVDTGSTVTYVPCSSCTHCGTHQDPNFKPEASNSYTPKPCGAECAICDTERKQCQYERQYAEMSTSKGLLGSDLVSFGGNSTLGSQRLVFGCETAETGDLYDQRADGIMGLGRGRLSIVNQLVQQKAIADSFSLCYGGMGEGGGAMIMGAIPPPPGIVFTKSDFQRSRYYNLGLEEVRIGGSPLPVQPAVFDSKFGTVLDSGTTYAYFPEEAFLAFRNTLIQQVKGLNQVDGPDPQFKDLCFAGAGTNPSELTRHFPLVELKFRDGQVLPLDPENYFFKHSKVSGAYCLGVFNNGKDSATLIGGIVVRNTLVTYDRGNEKIGFWKTNCTDLWNSLEHAQKTPPSPESSSEPKDQPPKKPIVPSHNISGSTCVSGSLEVEMVLLLNDTSFSYLQSTFVEDLSHELNVDLSQVKVINFTKNGDNITALWAVYLTAPDDNILNRTCQNIVAHLTQQSVHFHNSVGVQQISGWKLTLSDKGSGQSTRLQLASFAIISLALLVVSGIGVGVWWYFWRYRGQVKYVSLSDTGTEITQL